MVARDSRVPTECETWVPARAAEGPAFLAGARGPGRGGSNYVSSYLVSR